MSGIITPWLTRAFNFVIDNSAPGQSVGRFLAHCPAGSGSRNPSRATSRWLASAGVEFLQVKTLSAKHPDEGYEKTRAFYLAYGFRPLEEFPTLWSPESPALQLIKAIARN